MNLAARLEALCKEHGSGLLLSAATAEALPGVKLVPVGNIAARRLAEAVAVYSPAANLSAVA